MSDAIKLAIDFLHCVDQRFDLAKEPHAPGVTMLDQFHAALAALRAQPAEPLVFGMRGPKMTFTIGNQSFTLDYEPETTDEYVFMGNMLKAAISKLPLGVKIGAQPDHSEQHLEMVAAARAVVERWDTPLWKDAPATAGFINRLRDALPPAIEGKL